MHEHGTGTSTTTDSDGAHDLFPPVIETERLRLERRGSDHVDTRRIYEICADDDGIEDVTRWVPWDSHESLAETAAFLERGERAWGEGSTAGYVLRPREGEDGAGEIAGFGGLEVDWDRSLGVLGVWLRKPFWGRGYSGERATALVELAFDRLDLDVVTVSHVVDNEKSRTAISRYVDRLGGHREGVRRNSIAFPDGTVHDEVHYSVDAAEWRAATDGGTDVLSE